MKMSDTAPLQKEQTAARPHPIHDLAKRPKKGISEAGKRMEESGTKGSFTKMAHARGEGVQEAASDMYNAPGKAGQKARFAFLAGHNWNGKK